MLENRIKKKLETFFCSFDLRNSILLVKYLVGSGCVSSMLGLHAFKYCKTIVALTVFCLAKLYPFGHLTMLTLWLIAIQLETFYDTS